MTNTTTTDAELAALAGAALKRGDMPEIVPVTMPETFVGMEDGRAAAAFAAGVYEFLHRLAINHSLPPHSFRDALLLMAGRFVAEQEYPAIERATVVTEQIERLRHMLDITFAKADEFRAHAQGHPAGTG